MMPRRSLAHEGVEGVRDGKPPGARGGIQILGMVRGEWLRLAPQAYGGGAGCWVIAGTWPPPGVSVASRLLLVCSCSPGSLPLLFPVSSRLPLQSRWFLNAASSASSLLCVSSRLPLQSRGFLNAASSASSLLCVTWRLPLQASSRLRVASGVLGARGLASPGPNLGAKARLFASSLCLWVPSFSEWCLPFSRCFCCSAFLDISPLCSDWAALHLCVPGVGSRFTTISSFAHFC